VLLPVPEPDELEDPEPLLDELLPDLLPEPDPDELEDPELLV